jgi:hypothetical protein
MTIQAGSLKGLQGMYKPYWSRQALTLKRWILGLR